MEIVKQSYFPQLDSIRGISFIAIFLYHAVHVNVDGRGVTDFLFYLYSHLHLAVDIFFVLSSFLLTWLGLNEYAVKGVFSLKNFFVRRILRIWPLYYAILLFTFTVLPLAGKYLHIHISLPPSAWYLFFVSNFYYIDHIYYLRMLWTLSVEEQFYVALGICFKYFANKLTHIFILFIVLSLCFSVYASVYDVATYTHTVTYLFDFAIGGLAAICLHKRSWLLEKRLNFTKWGSIIFYTYLPVHFIIFYVIDKNVSAQYSGLINRLLFIIYLALFILEQIINKQRLAFLEHNRFLILTGKISFGLYCFHGITLTFVYALLPGIKYLPAVLKVTIVFGINYAISLLCYYYFESYFLRLKTRFRSA